VFAQLATKYLLRDDLLNTAQALGFNAPVPFDVPALMGNLNVPYNDLEFARTAAGFQGSTLSPLGAAYLTSIIARGGEAMRLRILDTQDKAEHGVEKLGRVISARTAQRIARMMEVTVRNGTSRAAFSDERGRPYLKDIRVSGKTGTLQPKPRGTMTSWFVGFAPSRKPEVVVSVMLQNGPVWRRKANEIARDLLRVYFRERGRTDISDPFEAAPTTHGRAHVASHGL
jgi:cell division protein FtsI/penicillin-binding protein 2